MQNTKYTNIYHMELILLQHFDLAQRKHITEPVLYGDQSWQYDIHTSVKCYQIWVMINLGVAG